MYQNSSAPKSEDKPAKDNMAEQKSRLGPGEKIDFGNEEPGSDKKRKAKAAEKKDKKKKKKSSEEAAPETSCVEKQPQVTKAMKDRSTESNEEATVEVVEHETSSGSVVRQNQRYVETPDLRIYPNGLRIDELRIGTGKEAIPGDTISIHFTGKLENGEIYDSTCGKPPFRFRLGFGRIIKAFDVGVSGMRVDGKRKITIPPIMGYRKGWTGGIVEIPPNAWLIIEVELVKVRSEYP